MPFSKLTASARNPLTHYHSAGYSCNILVLDCCRSDVRDSCSRFMDVGGLVDGSLFWNFLLVAAVLVCSHPLRSRFCIPSRMGGRAFSRKTPACHPAATPGWSGDFHFVFGMHDAGRRCLFVHSPLALNLSPEDAAYHSAAGFVRIHAGRVRRSVHRGSLFE